MTPADSEPRPAPRLLRAFYRRDPVFCARRLVGCVLHWDGLAGRIVETEAYSAQGDEACHTFHRPSARLFVATHRPGDAYVYFNYGMHWLFNILVGTPEQRGFVLIRALEPVAGLELMRARRAAARRDSDLCSGPGKLCAALGIHGQHHGLSLVRSTARCVRAPDVSLDVTADTRIGISLATDKPWRFLARDNPSVSRAPKAFKKEEKKRKKGRSADEANRP